ncbi:hypothetical protein QBC39DRAFT_344630 [Podospora conica]|nr:hypothetical protein QBC39DRAFT_344630 [Schizothecium conicum]
MPYLDEDSDGEDGHSDAHDHQNDVSKPSDDASSSNNIGSEPDDSTSESNDNGSKTNNNPSDPSDSVSGSNDSASGLDDDASDPSDDGSESNDNGSGPDDNTSDHSDDASDHSDDASELSDDSDNGRGRRTHAGMFDMEAEESGDEDIYSDEEHGDDQEPVMFPQWSRLPAEIRRMIWEEYCPEMVPPNTGRVYDILEDMPTRFVMNVTLPERTLPARTVLAVNQESRRWALKAFPDELELPFPPARNILRFDKQKDVVIFNHRAEPRYRSSFLQQVQNLAINAEFYLNLEDLPQPGSDELPNLRQLFFLVDASHCRVRDTLSWCTAKDSIVSSQFTFWEESGPGGPTAHRFQYCWPDLNKWPNFIGHESEISTLWGVGRVPFPREFTAPGGVLANAAAADESDDESQVDPDEQAQRVKSMVRDTLAQWPIYPLVEFNGKETLRNILAWNGNPQDWDSEWNDEDGYDSDDDGLGAALTDEYDSSGIDDSEIEELSQGDEDEDDLELDDVDDEDDLGLDGDSDQDLGSEFPPQLPPAHFSSPESVTVRGDSTSSSDGEGPVQRSRKRRIISDDEDEDEDDSMPRKRVRRSKVVDPDDSEEDSGDEMMGIPEPHEDEDSDDSMPRKRVRRSKVVDSDDSDEDDSDDEMMEIPEPPRPKTKGSGKRTNPIELESESESESGSGSSSASGDDESEDDAQPKKPLSLAEKLALNRRENPIPISDSDSDQADNDGMEGSEEEGDEEDHDGGTVGEYAYGGPFQDDEEGNDDSSAQEEAQEEGMFEDDDYEY